jgi:hypothetical protein
LNTPVTSAFGRLTEEDLVSKKRKTDEENK